MLAKIKNWARKLKQQASILQLVYHDTRTPLRAKVLIWFTLGYLFSPIDLIPDFIPVLGLLDDLIIIPLLIVVTVKLIPKMVWDEAVAKAQKQAPASWQLNWMIVGLLGAIWVLGGYLFLLFLKNNYYK